MTFSSPMNHQTGSSESKKLKVTGIVGSSRTLTTVDGCVYYLSDPSNGDMASSTKLVCKIGVSGNCLLANLQQCAKNEGQFDYRMTILTKDSLTRKDCKIFRWRTGTGFRFTDMVWCRSLFFQPLKRKRHLTESQLRTCVLELQDKTYVICLIVADLEDALGVLSGTVFWCKKLQPVLRDGVKSPAFGMPYVRECRTVTAASYCVIRPMQVIALWHAYLVMSEPNQGQCMFLTERQLIGPAPAAAEE